MMESTERSQTLSSRTEQSVFEQHTPQRTESLRVEVLRGAVLTGPRPRDPTAHVRTYDITVEPGGNLRKVKDALRETRRPLSSRPDRSPGGNEELPDGIASERFSFRRERARRFKVGSHFPALVASPRILPPWPASSEDSRSSSRATAALSPRAAREVAASQLTRPTVSHSMKLQTKRCEESARPWLVSGAAGTGELISDRKPALYEESYDSPYLQQREDYQSSKSRWVGEATILPANRAACQATCNSTWPSTQSHIAAVRERGRALNESLHERYQAKRQTFQQEKKDRGPLSSFERRLEAAERAREEERLASQAKEQVDTKPIENPMAGFKTLVNLKKSS